MRAAATSYAVSLRDVGLLRIRRDLGIMLGAPVRPLLPGGRARDGIVHLGWGRKPSGLAAVKRARSEGGRFLLIEDGFLRSAGLGVSGSRLLSVVHDATGIYYDATSPSDLERMLQEGGFSQQSLRTAQELIALIRREGLSKYNDGLPVPPERFPPGEERVLVVDQTAGDLSLKYGLAGSRSFSDMLEAALDENPSARICVKTHPDVLAGHRAGCLPEREDPRIEWITEHFHPHDLLAHFHKVYVVTSLMGLDALLLGREVHCFGMPFYAGWGLTVDRLRCARRTARRSLEELVAASHVEYACYLDPVNSRRCDVLTVARLLARQKRRQRFWPDTGSAPWSGRVFAFGFRTWKRAQVKPFFGPGVRVRFVSSVARARRLGIGPRDRLAVWGLRDPEGLGDLAGELGLKIVRVEDGFLRSVGLGSDFVPPMSLVFDPEGIYFDPSGPSLLEEILAHADIPEELVTRARRLRHFIVAHRLTKYNLGRNAPPLRLPAAAAGRKVVLVPGQVETDASILRGCGKIRTNLALLEVARRENPDAFIVYKPHPDVLERNRKGRVHLHRALRHCDHVEERADIISCLEAADAVHTMTSLSGFDALLRGKSVTCHGAPFYAGWGLTDDRIPMPRRRRRRTLDELVAATLLLCPTYADRGWIVPAEHVAARLAEERSAGGGAAMPAGMRKYLFLLRGLASSLRRP